MKPILPVVFIASVLTGCAQTPNTSISYYSPKTSVKIQATRLLTCSNDHQIYSSQTVTAAALNSADITKPIPLNLGLLNSTFANTSFTAEFLEDGRLKGINVSETGKVGEIVKSAASLVKLAFAGLGLDGSTLQYFPKLCAIISAEKDKIVTLKYELVFDPELEAAQGYSWDVPLTSESQYFRAKAASAGAELQPIDLTILRTEVVKPTLPAQGKGQDGVSFKYPAQATFVLASSGAPLWQERLPIAQLGADGWLPIARAPAFGKATTIIDLNDNGSLKKVSYGSETGSKAAVEAASEGLSLVAEETNAARAAAAEAEVKRIKAERDLLRCRADPGNC